MWPCKPFAHSWSTARFSCICRAPLWADARCKFGQKGKIDCLKRLRKALFSKPAQLVFEMKIVESTDDKLSIDFHYCPLVKAWQNAGCTDEEIAKLCDIAMCGDHGIGENYGSVLDLPKCIAKGNDICALRYLKMES